MIRFIDLRHHTEDLGGDRFAFWDTVTDTFVTDDIGCQTWETIDQFTEGYLGPQKIERFIALTPGWAKATKAATDPRHITSEEMHWIVKRDLCSLAGRVQVLLKGGPSGTHWSDDYLESGDLLAVADSIRKRVDEINELYVVVVDARGDGDG